MFFKSTENYVTETCNITYGANFIYIYVDRIYQFHVYNDNVAVKRFKKKFVYFDL